MKRKRGKEAKKSDLYHKGLWRGEKTFRHYDPAATSSNEPIGEVEHPPGEAGLEKGTTGGRPGATYVTVHREMSRFGGNGADANCLPLFLRDARSGLAFSAKKEKLLGRKQNAVPTRRITCVVQSKSFLDQNNRAPLWESAARGGQLGRRGGVVSQMTIKVREGGAVVGGRA